VNEGIPICFICGDKVCQCMMSIPEEKRICHKCKAEKRIKDGKKS